MNNKEEITSSSVKNDYSNKLHDVRWQKKRNSILMRDNYTCQCCGANDKYLHVHHLKYISDKGKFIDPWDYPDEMLITLCEHCHQEVHKQADDEYLRYTRLLIDEFKSAIEDIKDSNEKEKDVMASISVCLYDLKCILYLLKTDILKGVKSIHDTESSLILYKEFNSFVDKCDELSQNFFQLSEENDGQRMDTFA